MILLARKTINNVIFLYLKMKSVSVLNDGGHKPLSIGQATENRIRWM